MPKGHSLIDLVRQLVVVVEANIRILLTPRTASACFLSTLSGHTSGLLHSWHSRYFLTTTYAIQAKIKANVMEMVADSSTILNNFI